MLDLKIIFNGLIAGLLAYSILITYNWFTFLHKVKKRHSVDNYQPIMNRVALWSLKDSCLYSACFENINTANDILYNRSVERYRLTIKRDIQLRCPMDKHTTILAIDSIVLCTRAELDISINSQDNTIRVHNIYTGKYRLDSGYLLSVYSKLFNSLEELLDYIKPSVFPQFNPATGVQYVKK